MYQHLTLIVRHVSEPGVSYLPVRPIYGLNPNVEPSVTYTPLQLIGWKIRHFKAWDKVMHYKILFCTIVVTHNFEYEIQ